MKAVAFANNDMAIVAWTFGGKVPNCVGFAVYRIDVRAGTESCLPAMATFEGQDATKGRTTAEDPVQKFFWKDVFANRGGTYRYRVVPMQGTAGHLQPMPYGPLVSNQIQLSPHYGTLSAYFNRGILATQATKRALADGTGPLANRLDAHIMQPGDPLRNNLAGQMIEALTTLSDEATGNGGAAYCALYEFQDPDAVAHLAALKDRAHVVLSNMPDKDTVDTYADERKHIHDAGADVADRFMKTGHIGHNKFEILDHDGPKAVLFGSTNWTSHGLCAQTNNSVIARSPALAAAYREYWTRLRDDTQGGKALQAPTFRETNAQKIPTIDLEDGSGTVDLWFSPNTPGPRGKKHGDTEAVPPDLVEVFAAIANARQAILFLAFQPGSPSIVEAIAAAVKAKPGLFVRGAVTAPDASGAFYTAISGGTPTPHKKGDPPLPEDYRVIHAQGIHADDAFGQWEAELNLAGHAVVHDKIVVIDPFSDTCVVVTGSHNLGYKASYDNDENLAIIRNHRAVAEAYAAHCLDVYDHYAWRYWLAQNGDKAWHFLAADDSWQDSYYAADDQVKSAELAFWLSAIPAAEAVPTPNQDASTRVKPAAPPAEAPRQRQSAKPRPTRP